jgi:hypothetical protein
LVSVHSSGRPALQRLGRHSGNCQGKRWPSIRIRTGHYRNKTMSRFLPPKPPVPGDSMTAQLATVRSNKHTRPELKRSSASAGPLLQVSMSPVRES